MNNVTMRGFIFTLTFIEPQDPSLGRGKHAARDNPHGYLYARSQECHALNVASVSAVRRVRQRLKPKPL